MYQINGFLKMAEKDNFEEGCDPTTSQHSMVEIVLKSETTDGLIDEVKSFFGIDDDSIQKNACDEDGRIDIVTLENGEGYNAFESQIEKWKQGNLDLWSVIYTGQVLQVESTVVKL